MQAQRLVDLERDRVRDGSQSLTSPLHRDGSDLLGLRLGVALEPRVRGSKQDLERVDAFDVRCHQNQTVMTPRPSRPAVAWPAVIANDDRWPVACLPPTPGQESRVSTAWMSPRRITTWVRRRWSIPRVCHPPPGGPFLLRRFVCPPNPAVRRMRTARWSATDRDSSPAPLAYSSRNWTSSPMEGQH